LPTCICQLKKFSGVIPRTSVSNGGRKAKGRVGLEGIEGREWKDEGEAKVGEGIREDSAPKLN
jgi:hypothetical protein